MRLPATSRDGEAGRMWTGARPLIERASPTDRAFLAIDRASTIPQQFGVALVLDSAADLDLDAVRRLVAVRIAAVPRLRQRLRTAPPGCGGPLWVDDFDFDVARHIEAVAVDGGGEAAIVEVAARAVSTRLPDDRPLWSLTFIPGLTGGRAGLVVVLHHVLADGVGGLAILTDLLDPGVTPADSEFPQLRPSVLRLAADAWGSRLAAARRTGRSWRMLRTSMSASGGVRPPRARRTPLNRRTGPHRRLAAVRVDRPTLRAAAHRSGASTNDALLVAVGASLRRVLAERGTSLDPVMVAVPVSGRRTAGGGTLGNLVSPLLVAVPTTGPVEERLRRVSDAVHRPRSSATGPPPIALLGWVFRPLALAGGYRIYMSRQRRLHTLVSSLRGPEQSVTFGGRPVSAVLPVSVGQDGNLSVQFSALSYGGTLAVTIAADPDVVPHLDSLTEALRTDLDAIAPGCVR